MNTPDDIDRAARILWDYLQMHHQLEKSDAVFVLASFDTRVAERAAELYGQSLGEYVIISGGNNPLTTKMFGEPEAALFARIAQEHGVPADKIIIEDKSANTGENIRFTYALLQEKHLQFDSFILVQKPYMERRTFATFKKQWPDPDTRILVTSPQIAYEGYPNDSCPKDLVLNVMTGDMQRIREYPKLGFQIEQEISAEVWAAWEELVAAGYNKHLI
jgi:uncharacterized SAM-binding protein YcdF (DUF218 family)